MLYKFKNVNRKYYNCFIHIGIRYQSIGLDILDASSCCQCPESISGSKTWEGT